MVKNYSMPGRIWRIIYPVIIFIAVQLVVMLIVGVIVSLTYSMSVMADSGVFDAEATMDEAFRYMTERSMLILLIANIVGLAAFIPMWAGTRKWIEPRKNDSPALVCLMVVGLFASFNILQMIIFALTDVMKYFPSYDSVADMLSTDSFAVQLLAMGVAAPAIEELVFRGILINRMKWLPSWAAVLVQALLFGAVHMNLFQSLYAFVAGAILGIIYVKFRSIVIVIAGHMSYNLSSLLISEVADDKTVMVALLASIVVLPVCVFFTVRHKKAEAILAGGDIIPPPVYMPMNPWERR